MKTAKLACDNLKINSTFLVVLGSVFIALGAQISLPLTPVPITLQTFAVLSAGMVLGSRLGTQAVLLYLIEGACGLPVFANFSFGWQYLVGPTGGYLLGFLPATFLCSYLLENGFARNRIATLFAALFSSITLFIPGYVVLACFIGTHNAYLFGVEPFYLIETAKILAFTFAAPYFWKSND